MFSDVAIVGRRGIIKFRSIGGLGGRRSFLQNSCNYRKGSRDKDLAVSVRSRSRLSWLDSRKYVDDGR